MTRVAALGSPARPSDAIIDAHARAIAAADDSAPNPAVPTGIIRAPDTHSAKKRKLMAQARRHGWTGKTYRGALKFERERELARRRGAQGQRQ